MPFSQCHFLAVPADAHCDSVSLHLSRDGQDCALVPWLLGKKKKMPAYCVSATVLETFIDI